MSGSVSPIPGVVAESLDCDDVHWEHPVQEEPESGSEPSRQIPIFPVRVLAICVRVPWTRDIHLAAALPTPPHHGGAIVRQGNQPYRSHMSDPGTQARGMPHISPPPQRCDSYCARLAHIACTHLGRGGRARYDATIIMHGFMRAVRSQHTAAIESTAVKQCTARGVGSLPGTVAPPPLVGGGAIAAIGIDNCVICVPVGAACRTNAAKPSRLIPANASSNSASFWL